MAYQFEKSGKLKEPTAEELAAADADSKVIVYDTGTLKDGRPYWVYIAVKPSMYSEFMSLSQKRQTIAYEKYGTILKHGFEKKASEAVKEEMMRTHGCNDNYMETIAKEIRAAQTAFIKDQEAHRIDDILTMMKKQGGAKP